MKTSAMKLAIAGVLAVTLALPALAAPRHSGGRSAHSGGHSGGHSAAGRHAGGRNGARHHGGSARYYAPRAAVYLGVPLIAAAAYYGPRYYYPPAYVARGPGILYYCAAYNDYYPRVQACPGGWQQVMQQPAIPYLPGYPPPHY